jgi:hypothetical protein
MEIGQRATVARRCRGSLQPRLTPEVSSMSSDEAVSSCFTGSSASGAGGGAPRN